MSLFLTQEELAELTGIKRGRDGKSRNQLQCEHLRMFGVPFIPNAAGEPKVARSAIEGSIKTTAPKQSGWRPAAMSV